METLQKQHLFWDIDLKKLNPSDHESFIVRRILSLGDSDDFRWVIGQYGEKRVKELFLENFNKLDLKSQSFFCSYFNIDKEQCIRKQSTKKQGAFWRK